MNAKDADFVFKVVIIGDSNVGKTTLLKKYIGEQRLGEDFGKSVINNHTLRQPIVKKKVERNSVKVSLEIHDTMGKCMNERTSLRPSPFHINLKGKKEKVFFPFYFIFTTI